MRALIIGPPDSPYEFGFFEVNQSVIKTEAGWLIICSTVSNQIRKRQQTQTTALRFRLLTRPAEYPTKAPSVNAITTNFGRTRFNPNIYAGGKVCLSILGCVHPLISNLIGCSQVAGHGEASPAKSGPPRKASNPSSYRYKASCQ